MNKNPWAIARNEALTLPAVFPERVRRLKTYPMCPSTSVGGGVRKPDA